ncbi:DUF2130 domain-containing protein [Streptococcus equinus]|uniref:DUF2130 domain-containing protein n=1 Tax=Streptococcus equinus TaxID=1335 RepID=UPI000E03F9A9|nr:DUF2130 domain-containing protein [Streptococcus equinus]SUO80172.1 Serine/threonine-protein kinase MRCK beta [Streptococcus equinus]
MSNIKCPHCGTVFTINETEYSQLLAQVRSSEFDKELHERLAKEKALMEEKSKNDLQTQVSIKDQEIAELSAQLEQLKQTLELENQRQLSQKDQEIAELSAQLEQLKQTLELENQRQLSQKDQEIITLKSQLDNLNSVKKLELKQALAEKDKELVDLNNQIERLSLENKTSLVEAVASVEKERDDAKAKLALQEKEAELSLASVKSDYEAQLKAANEQVEFYKNFKAQQSTKAIGESLEVYAETEFNKVRAYAFPNATFGKDNEVSSRGSKGDFIYRETDENGVEILSIMFEMKNEADETKTKHKNKDFYKELDKDRREKNCEYAVLVTMLEVDNDYFNTGIVDVSHEYEKMYVVRPQLFIQLIGILRNAALNSLKYKQELALVREQNIDITHFEDDLEAFKNAFAKNYNSASNNFKKAIDEIDKSIRRMEEVKRFLTTSENQLRLANNKLDDVSVKKLTRKNPTMRAKFEALKD